MQVPTSAMNTIPDKALIEEVALVKGVSEAFIEKDWYATQVIRLLSEKPQQDFILVFTGGTALSKAHRLIHRFSEDIDFRVLAPALDGKNNSQVRKTMSGFKKSVVELLNTGLLIPSKPRLRITTATSSWIWATLPGSLRPKSCARTSSLN